MADKTDGSGQGVSPSRVVLDKKGLAAWKTNADLHVLLIMKQHPGVSKSNAVVQAYHEGVDGLGKRLSP